MPKGELWQLYDKNGEPIMDGGYPSYLGNPKDEEGIIYGSTVIWLYKHTSSGIEILWQRRSDKVDKYPGKWDISAGGHINYGETLTDAALREAREEIGIEITQKDLEFVVASPRNHNCIYHCYAVNWTDKKDEFHFDDGEVSEVRWVPLGDVDSFRSKYAKPPLAKDHQHFKFLEDWFREYGNL